MPRKITKVAILGGGLMGSGIATAMILSNYPVVLKEVNEKFLNAGIDRIKGGTWFSIILNPPYCFGKSFDISISTIILSNLLFCFPSQFAESSKERENDRGEI